MKIYTSYYANRTLRNFSPDALRSISVGLPKEMTCTQVKALAPDWNTVQAYKDGSIDWAGYTEQYMAKLDRLGIAKIMPMLEDGSVYLCYEGKVKNCHRHLLADWLRGYDIKVEEL